MKKLKLSCFRATPRTADLNKLDKKKIVFRRINKNVLV